jgi:adenosylcobinamide hydrolase
MPRSLATLTRRYESGRALPVLVWRFPQAVRAIASAPLGGGIGLRQWVVNATVVGDYDRLDPDVHLSELADSLGLAGAGAGLLTAVDVRRAVTTSDAGVTVVATVGLGHPTLAAATDDGPATRVGTINVVALVPAQLSDAALVNAVATATEAKVQALWEYGLTATGTASDAVFVGCLPDADGAVEPFGGPRSTWGARLARAVHAAVRAGTERWFGPTVGRTFGPTDPSRP